MNGMIWSRLSLVAVLSVIVLVLAGCQQICLYMVPTVCFGVCGLAVPDLASLFGLSCLLVCLAGGASNCGGMASQACADDPDECAATLEQMQSAAIQFCGEYPEECQEAFETWVDSLEEEVIQ